MDRLLKLSLLFQFEIAFSAILTFCVWGDTSVYVEKHSSFNSKYV